MLDVKSTSTPLVYTYLTNCHILLIINKAFEHGVTTSLNPQYDASERWCGGIKDMAPYLTLFICNEVNSYVPHVQCTYVLLT
jgi:hypothetical protein